MSTTPSLIILNSAGAGADLEAVNIALVILNIFLNVTMNGIVLVVLRHQKELQEYMRVLYQVLAVSNMAFGVQQNLWSILWFSLAGTKSCEIISLVFPLGYQVSFMSIMACLCGISFHLYLLVTKPLRYYTIMTRARFYFSLASTFLVILLICSIYLPIPESPFIQLLTTRCLNQDPSVQGQWTSMFHTIVQICPIFATMAFTTIIYIRLLFILHNLRNVEPVPETIRYARNPPTESGFDNCRHDGHQPENVHTDPARDANINLGRPSKMKFKGFFTIFLLTGSFYIVWAPYAISFVTPFHPTFLRIMDRFCLCMASVQPMISLVTNSEARKLCLASLRQCLNKLTWKTNSRG